MKKSIYILIIMAILCIAGIANAAKIVIKSTDGKIRISEIAAEKFGGFSRIVVPKENIPSDAETVAIYPFEAEGKIGEDGYCVMPSGMLTKFTERKDGVSTNDMMPLSLGGIKVGERAFAAIVDGSRLMCRAAIEKKGDKYRMFFRFKFGENKPYEEISIYVYELSGADANYAGMARTYRKRQLELGIVRPLKERVKNSPELKYAAEAPEVRMRLGWKPWPSPVEEQTVENEPEMNVKITFDRVRDIELEMKRQGIDKAEICLVGWNKSGHDGRWPQSFPVEEKLGGESRLKELIKEVQADGYQIVCHSNAVGACRIADCFNEDDISRFPNGDMRKSSVWSGGRYYRICPKRYHETLSKANIEKIAALGFRGLHYIDVISTVPPVGCNHPKHPTTARESGKFWTSELADAAKLMGGAASEGGFDFAASRLDSGLYITFKLNPKNYPKMADRYVPLWHIVYNGIILSNAATDTMNYAIKEPEFAMKVVEFATRPTFYFYSAFGDKAEKNWMGNVDLRCGTDEEMRDAVAAIKKGSDLMKEIGYLQYEFMDDHSEIAPDVFVSKFSDGTRIVCNYAKNTFDFEGEKIEPLKYRVFKPAKK